MNRPVESAPAAQSTEQVKDDRAFELGAAEFDAACLAAGDGSVMPTPSTADAEQRTLSRAGAFALTVLLGSLSAIGPLATDMYLPGFPDMAEDMGATLGAIQSTLAVYFVGLAVGQLFYGPVADRFGRKGPLLLGLSLFTLAAVGCALASGVEALVAMRFCQAMGGCALMVIARAIVRDYFNERDSARVFSSLILVMGAAPILAPLLGGWLAVAWGWRSIFWFQAGFGVLCLMVTVLFLSESLPRDRRRLDALQGVLPKYMTLFKDRAFVTYSLICGSAFAGMFAYIGGSPLVFIKLHGISPEHFGYYFGLNAIGFIGASQVNGYFVRTVDPRRILRIAVRCCAVAGVALLFTAATGLGGFVGLFIPLFCFVATIGFIGPTATALALTPHGKHAGNASAVLGFIQFGVSAAGGILVSTLQNGSALPMVSLMAGGGVVAWLLSRQSQ